MPEPSGAATLRLVVRTPEARPFDALVRSARVPTETGQVGLRPRGERQVLAVEAGLIVVTGAGEVQLLATAGGLLEQDGQTAALFTPFAVTGGSEEEVLGALAEALAADDGVLAVERQIEELEQRILQKMRDPTGAGAPRRIGDG